MSVGPDGAPIPPAVVEDPTAEGDARNAEAEANKGRMIASLQAKVAEGKQAKAERDRLIEENDRLKRALSPAAPGSGVDPHQQFRQTMDWAEGRVDGNVDPVAAVAVRNATDNALLNDRLEERDALDEIGDADTRKAVKAQLAALKQNGMGGADAVSIALAQVKARQADEMTVENARLQEALRVAQTPPAQAPPTHHRGVPAAELKSRTFDSLGSFEEAVAGMSSLERLKVEEMIDKGEVKFKR